MCRLQIQHPRQIPRRGVVRLLLRSRELELGRQECAESSVADGDRRTQIPLAAGQIDVHAQSVLLLVEAGSVPLMEKSPPTTSVQVELSSLSWSLKAVKPTSVAPSVTSSVA